MLLCCCYPTLPSSILPAVEAELHALCWPASTMQMASYVYKSANHTEPTSPLSPLMVRDGASLPAGIGGYEGHAVVWRAQGRPACRYRAVPQQSCPEQLYRQMEEWMPTLPCWLRAGCSGWPSLSCSSFRHCFGGFGCRRQRIAGTTSPPLDPARRPLMRAAPFTLTASRVCSGSHRRPAPQLAVRVCCHWPLFL